MRKSNILIVEDNLIIALDLQEQLLGLGYKVAGTVDSGEQAVTKALEMKPDLILMDINLNGDMNGIEAVRKIRQTCNTPVIYLTANSEALNQIDESDSYLSKPFSDRELQHMIASVLQMENEPVH